VQYKEKSQEKSEQDVVKGMKEEADYMGKVMHTETIGL